MNSPSISVLNLHKHFDSLKAVDGISFDIFPGQVVGFIGANGAGKTTTMRIVATLELPDNGEVRICGYDAVHYPKNVRHLIGWMPAVYDSYERTTTLEYLDFYARAYGYHAQERNLRVLEVIEFTELAALSERYIDTLSQGMKQRLCLARMLIHDPSVLILDEPAAGLDPEARVEFKHLIRLLAQKQKAIFISSHILSELDDMCDTMIFIDNGQLVYHGGA